MSNVTESPKERSLSTGEMLLAPSLDGILGQPSLETNELLTTPVFDRWRRLCRDAN